MEYADVCIKCQNRHLNEVKKTDWKVICSGIPKSLWEKNHYPLEEIISAEEYLALEEDELISLHYKYNKILWAKDNINWSTFNEKRNFDQYYQKELLLCTAKRKVGRLGRRMGKCISEETFIQTKEKGLIKSKYLTPGMSVLTFDTEQKKYLWTNNWIKHNNGIKKIFKLSTRLGSEDIVTDNHPYYKATENGLEWVELKDLKIGDKIVSIKDYKELIKDFSKEKIPYEKGIIPDQVWNSNLASLSEWVGLLMNDCFNFNRENINTFSCDYEFIVKIKTIFRRFGINLIMRKAHKYSKDGYELYTFVREEMFNIYNLINNFREKERLGVILTKRTEVIPNHFFTKIMPKEFNRILQKDCLEKFGSKYVSKKKVTQHNYLRGLSYEKTNRINKHLKNDFVDFILNGNIIFDEVTSIESVGEGLTFDLEVPGTNNFVTNDLLTHNSEVLSVDALHFACNNPGKTVMILTPFQNTADELYERMCGMLEGEFSVYKTRFKKKAKPNTITIFVEGKKSVIKLFTTGTKSGSEGASTRGQKADRIYFDETAYFTNKDIETVYALALESEDVEIIAFSTPTALKTLYRNWCTSEPNWKDFHFPSTILPNYESMKEEISRTYDEQGFAQEILADFFESSGKVFLTESINSSLRMYNYFEKITDLENFEQWVTVLGVDWNEWKNGIQIVVYGFNMVTKRFRVLNRTSIHKTMTGEKNIQTAALDKIAELDENFKSKFVYVDKGFGSTQSEILEKYYFQKGTPHKFKSIDFNSNYSRKNLLTGETETKRMKGMLVYFLQKKFEYKEIEISSVEETGELKLIAQLDHYIIDHYDSKDNPVFASGAKCGDHILDALMLANFAFIENFDNILSFSDVIAITPKSHEINIAFNNVIKDNELKMSNTKTHFMNIYQENNFIKKSEGQTPQLSVNGSSVFGSNKGKIKRTSIL